MHEGRLALGHLGGLGGFLLALIVFPALAPPRATAGAVPTRVQAIEVDADGLGLLVGLGGRGGLHEHDLGDARLVVNLPAASAVVLAEFEVVLVLGSHSS